jgi:hypothetical protein
MRSRLVISALAAASLLGVTAIAFVPAVEVI